jgi:cellulose synthase/poly-beta-1,6-N-acetylglucosamine synthase-like glycosyltransferase
MTALAIVFWVAAGLILYTHLGYPLVLWLLARGRGEARPRPLPSEPPRVSLVVAAHDEEAGIVRFLRSALALRYPRDRLEVVVVSDGSSDHTAEWAAKAGADRVIEVPRGGKVAALNAGVEEAGGEVLAFADANAAWEPDALERLVGRLLDDPRVGYVCGQVRLETIGGENQEGLYWGYEMAIRALESRLAGITGGNGAINAVRREAYLALEPSRGQDISLPFELTRRGWRAVYEPTAAAREPAAATLDAEFSRKRRMLTGAWAALLRYGMLSARGYPPAYAFEIYSHRLLRYLAPVLHLVALGANIALVAIGGGPLYDATLALQLALLAAAALAPVAPARPLLVARYYVGVCAAGLLALYDCLRGEVPTTWEKAR